MLLANYGRNLQNGILKKIYQIYFQSECQKIHFVNLGKKRLPDILIPLKIALKAASLNGNFFN